MLDYDSTMDCPPVSWNLKRTLLTFLVKLMLIYHSLQLEVIHLPIVKSVGYSFLQLYFGFRLLLLQKLRFQEKCQENIALRS